MVKATVEPKAVEESGVTPLLLCQVRRQRLRRIQRSDAPLRRLGMSDNARGCHVPGPVNVGRAADRFTK